MLILSDLGQFPASSMGGALTVGKFDGVHLGHQRILAEASRLARKLGHSLAVMTFEPYPNEALHPEKVHERLMDQDDLCSQMEMAGVDVLIVQKFDSDFAAQSAEEFLNRLIASTGLKGLVVGPDFRYGRGKGGTVQDLDRWAKTSDVVLKRVPRVKIEGVDISSTAIKGLIKEHNYDLAAKMLGRRYYLRGEVVRGEGRGRTLNTPTANFIPTIQPALEAGVYAGWAKVDGEELRKAVMNVGRKPTFWRDQALPLTYECHILDFSGDLYGQTLHFEPSLFLRKEMKFSGVEELKSQIQIDLKKAREALA